MNGFSSSSSCCWGAGKLSLNGNGVALETGSSGDSGGVALIMSTSSYCPVTIATSLEPNWGISAAVEAFQVILRAS
jgi:hypothetical protein